MPHRHCLEFLASAAFMLSALCYAKEEPINLSTITNTAEPSSVEVMKLFRQKVGSHEKLFKLVDNSDSSVGLVLVGALLA